MTYLEKYIKDKGGLLSGELAQFLCDTENISPEAARKRIERIKSPLHKLKGLFEDNQSFIYHSDNYNNSDYFLNLEKAFKSSGKRCHAILEAINYHHGLILKKELANYSFSPIIKIKGHMLYSTLIEKLNRAQVIHSIDDDHYCLNSFLSDKIDLNLRHFKAIQFSKDLLLNQFSIWCKNIGLTSYSQATFNSQVGGFQFSFTAPSYINGLVQYKEKVPNPGFLVADILIGNSTDSDTIDFFLQKISSIRASNRSAKLIPVLIVDGTSTSAFNQLKKLGVLIATVREIFGDSYNELLKSLINTITNAGAILKKEPEKYIQLMDQLTKLVNGKTNNLRGDLFELAVGYYYGKLCQSLDIGRIIKLDSEPNNREVDVLAVFEKEVRVVECKGYNYSVDDEYVNKYLTNKIPFIRKWLEKIHPNKRQVFEIWSTGGFTVKATELLQKAKSNTKKYAVDYLGKPEILERAGELSTSKLSKVLKEYYFKDLV